MKRILAAIVHNEAGVLSRVTSVLNRRQVNIESISVGTTEQPEFSRMTIIINAENPLETEQVTKQLNKQIDVLKVSDITEDPILNGVVLIKVNAPTTTRSEIQAVIEPFRAHIVDVALKTIVVQVAGDSESSSLYRRVAALWNQANGSYRCDRFH